MLFIARWALGQACTLRKWVTSVDWRMACHPWPAICRAYEWWVVMGHIPVSLTWNIGDTDNICDNLSPYYFYRAVMPQCPSICPSVTFRCRDHIGWNTSKIISPQNSNKIAMWRFLRHRRLILRLHRPTVCRSLTHWAHRAVILAIAWFSC